MRILITALAALSATAALAAPAEASSRHDRCEPVVESELTRLQVEPGRVGDISLQVRSYNNRNDDTRVQGILGWVNLNDCTGRLVVDMTRHCRVKQSYTTGSCSVAGVPGY